MINEIIKAGSLGHGTPVFGDFDVDLVIYSSGKYIYCIARALECAPYAVLLVWAFSIFLKNGALESGLALPPDPPSQASNYVNMTYVVMKV